MTRFLDSGMTAPVTLGLGEFRLRFVVVVVGVDIEIAPITAGVVPHLERRHTMLHIETSFHRIRRNYK